MATQGCLAYEKKCKMEYLERSTCTWWNWYWWAITEELSLFVQRQDSALPTSSRSLRPRARITYKEHTSEEEEEEESEDEARPRPISACYLRGPPIGPRPKQVWLHLSFFFVLCWFCVVLNCVDAFFYKRFMLEINWRILLMLRFGKMFRIAECLEIWTLCTRLTYWNNKDINPT